MAQLTMLISSQYCHRKKKHSFQTFPYSSSISSSKDKTPSNHNKTIQSNNLILSANIKNQFLVSYDLDEDQLVDKNQSISNLSSPSPCLALWNNVSYEKIITQYKNHHHFTLVNQEQSHQKINQNDYNQNYHSYTTLISFITRQQYLKERQALDEHILYIKPTKKSPKRHKNS
ncbi:hypothetical protein I4U23_021154 [Adineta vaga]|nr:hypothetical protein I4U23_021154 [Adineta vaga]